MYQIAYNYYVCHIKSLAVETTLKFINGILSVEKLSYGNMYWYGYTFTDHYRRLSSFTYNDSSGNET
ncbi:hypothetical protein [Clostridium pasteurianum]|uniref:hypothetical protein n=1 Tax=Clostridium pasteurianum TaxID=1501 RepID=UPI00117C58F2|nr:hypothetical protein [Clostridium pasteurianum]